MKTFLISAIALSFVISSVAQPPISGQRGSQQPGLKGPLPPQPTPAPETPPPQTGDQNAGQTTTPANQGVATNPTGEMGAFNTIPTNPSANSAFGEGQAATTTGGSAPLFLNVTSTSVSDANGQFLGTLQQIALSPAGDVNFGIVNMGGRMVPVPWQLISTGVAGRSGLAVNTDRGAFQRAPAVAMGQLPLLTQEDVQAQIFGHFAVQNPNQSTVVTTGTARGGTGGAGVTITGGSTNTAGFTNSGAFATNRMTAATNGQRIPNNTASNQAVNTTGGLLSPTGRTNAAFDGFISGPGSTDRLGPRHNANPPPTPPPVVPSQSAQPPTGQQQPQ